VSSSRRPGDAGETLVESVISVCILGIGVVAVLGVIISGTYLTGEHRAATVSDVAVKVVAESVKSAPYVTGATTYSVPVVPVGHVATVMEVRCLIGTPAAVVASGQWGSCLPTDSGLQRVTVRVTSGVSAETTTIVKRRG
jgi:hypothetical protein